MKKDIFQGKVKEEYVGYILFGLIFVFLICAAVGGGFLFGAIITKHSNRMELLLPFKLGLGGLGILLILLGFAYFFGGIYVIRRFPAHEKWRHLLFNSDVYFVGSTSDEYCGSTRTRMGRRSARAHELVVMEAEMKKLTKGVPMPCKYKIYSAIVYAALAIDLCAFVAMFYLTICDPIPSLWEEYGALVVLGFLFVLAASAALMCVFGKRAWDISLDVASDYHIEWRSSLRQALWALSVRKYVKPGKKRKYWYRQDQLEQIQALLDEAPAALSLKILHKEGRAASFRILEDDEGKERLFFHGFFLR